MDKLLPVLLILPLLGLSFWLWMAWDLDKNDRLSSQEKTYWTLAFVFLNVFAAVYYYVYEYRKRQ
jgi:heme/copper-type cytochrome/quinol oxidase subunit 2